MGLTFSQYAPGRRFNASIGSRTAMPQAHGSGFVDPQLHDSGTVDQPIIRVESPLNIYRSLRENYYIDVLHS